jgi:hypothetical protein
VSTFGIDAEVRFASAADRAAFAEELAQTVGALVSRYHDENAPGGRRNRLVVGLHQIPAAAPDTRAADTRATESRTGQED